eukprot:TRINITY_DN21501_c0_g1_i1.p1 TRINITY_DN21501_c0_g1~~TRINITY_DN21501_c0_g1_i1.p1  ORF type:complete len:786 (+),score=145.03 TRINITY_DN21501_c0_g1_i1:36-2393(+)
MTSLAVPTQAEQQYIAAWLAEREKETIETGPGPVMRGVLVLTSFLLKPVSGLLYNIAGRKENKAWKDEERKTDGAVNLTMRPVEGPTDATAAWRLDCHKGRQIWHTVGTEGRPQDFIEKTHTQPDDLSGDGPCDLSDCLKRSGDYLQNMQSTDGHWSNDYGGPLFLLPGLVVTKYVLYKGDLEKMFPAPHRIELIRYIRNVQNTDGGWGLFEEGLSTLFGSVMNYVAMRMLGVAASDDRLRQARDFIKANGGAIGIPTWGKAWLCIANLYSWEGVRPVTPEMWLLPKYFPFYPGNMWCHTRMVYLPLGYLYGSKFQTPLDPLLKALRTEVFVEDFESINWVSASDCVAVTDVHYSTHWLAKIAFSVLRLYEKVHLKGLRSRALKLSIDHIKYDDVTTNFICLGPVNKVLNLVAIYAAEGHSEHLKLSEDRVQDYLWLGRNGLKMNGYNGSQLWDTSFALQAYKAAGMEEEYSSVVTKGLRYIDGAQVMVSPPAYSNYNRDDPYGAWNFSTGEQGWQVSDCTSEGLRCAILFNSLPRERIRAGIDQILSLRNPSDGAFSSYEFRRAPTWMELLNPAEIFTRIMVEYTYTECTSACMQTLLAFKKHDTENYRGAEINTALAKGKEAILGNQRADGSWYGSWGVCFTYGTMFGVEGLLAGGMSKQCKEITKAVEFLVSKQRSDGGWSEHVHACATRQYIEAACGSQPTQTGLALMTLVAAATPTSPPCHLSAIHKAAAFLIKTQRHGHWQQEPITGVFNGTCGIHYPFYPLVIPFWALGHYKQFLKTV